MLGAGITHMASATSIKAKTSVPCHSLRAVLYGLAIAVATYLAALACAAAQLHAAVVALMWPTSVLTRLFPPGEPVTYDSPSTPWLPLAGFALAWLIYSVASFYWLRRRHISAGA